jgi:hypothetical protein
VSDGDGAEDPEIGESHRDLRVLDSADGFVEPSMEGVLFVPRDGSS